MLFTIKVALLQLSIIGIDYGNITICSPFYCTGRKKNKTFNVASEFFMCFLIYRLRNTEHQTILDVLSEKLSAFFSWFGLEEYIMYVRQYYNGVVVFCARRAPALTNKLTAKRRISFWINKLFTSFLMNPYGLQVRVLQCIIIMQSSPCLFNLNQIKLMTKVHLMFTIFCDWFYDVIILSYKCLPLSLLEGCNLKRKLFSPEK